MCDQCPNCGSFKTVIKQNTPEIVSEKVIVGYDAFCLDCGATFEIKDIYTVNEAIQYYNGKETMHETW